MLQSKPASNQDAPTRAQGKQVSRQPNTSKKKKPIPPRPKAPPVKVKIDMDKVYDPVPELDWDNFDWNTKKDSNARVRLSQSDINAGVKILSKEIYAQDLYNSYAKAGVFNGSNISKDLDEGGIYQAEIIFINKKDETVLAQELNSFTTIAFPLKELIGSIGDEVSVMVLKKDRGSYIGSVARAMVPVLKKELNEKAANNEFFTVKILQLIDGGYIATYKDTIKCFVPGSQAAANVITDFNEYIDREIPVMIENYDEFNQLFIVSYKKYVANTMIDNISNLNFGKKYTGKLTADPLDFGIFVEFEGYFTGLIYHTEIPKFQQERKKLKSGDKIDFYVKDVTVRKSKNNEPPKIRIILTLDEKNIDTTKSDWQTLKNKCEGQELEYSYDNTESALEIIIPDTGGKSTYIHVDYEDVKAYLNSSTHIKIFSIDVMNQVISFDFA